MSAGFGESFQSTGLAVHTDCQMFDAVIQWTDGETGRAAWT
ncbi:hypothetical protein SAMN05446927_0952 [Caballeronia arationis]|jgi:hypothetical protein|uniref:Uncharacterized protein n=1 Tax=Caballeronia arationis TaxID=1777142 RepID=A0A7Z7N0U6_9BURK|nr:hypothetical protein SAMN05446927_0952 [Caballeronia arationis]